MRPHYLAFEQVTKRYGELDVVAPPFSFEIGQKEFVVFLGPSGCGKTTLMRMIGGLESLSSGAIKLHGVPLGPPDRRRGMVFQSYSSFPWLTVAANIDFGMRYRGDLSKAEKRERREHYLEMVGLADFGEAFPNKLSGGMRQRIAIARALASGSEILLMDEPFGALDAQRRERLQVELRRIQKEDAKTVVFVTHDVEEAVFLADRIVVFSKRPARILSVVDVAGTLGAERSLEVRDSDAFFRLRSRVLHMIRESAGETE
jgi:NitT/TauT family transport system ATP-binding protein